MHQRTHSSSNPLTFCLSTLADSNSQAKDISFHLSEVGFLRPATNLDLDASNFSTFLVKGLKVIF